MLKCYSHMKRKCIIHMSSKSISSKSNRIEYDLLNPKPPIHVDYPNFSFTVHKTGNTTTTTTTTLFLVNNNSYYSISI